MKISSGQTGKTQKKHGSQNRGWTNEAQLRRAPPRFVSPLTLEAEAAAKAGLIRQMLVSEQTEPAQRLVAEEVAEAQLDVSRIRAVRRKMMVQLDSESSDLVHLQRLAALDRYEGRALARRSRASSKLVT